MKMYFRTATVAVLLSAALIGGVQNAAALDKIRAGKAVAADWGFLPLDIGKEMGIYAKYGIDLDIVSFAGDAKLVQGLNSDSVDVGLASGPAMAFSAKGAAMIAVAAFDGGTSPSSSARIRRSTASQTSGASRLP